MSPLSFNFLFFLHRRRENKEVKGVNGRYIMLVQILINGKEKIKVANYLCSSIFFSCTEKNVHEIKLKGVKSTQIYSDDMNADKGKH